MVILQDEIQIESKLKEMQKTMKFGQDKDIKGFVKVVSDFFIDDNIGDDFLNALRNYETENQDFPAPSNIIERLKKNFSGHNHRTEFDNFKEKIRKVFYSNDWLKKKNIHIGIANKILHSEWNDDLKNELIQGVLKLGVYTKETMKILDKCRNLKYSFIEYSQILGGEKTFESLAIEKNEPNILDVHSPKQIAGLVRLQKAGNCE